MGNQIGNVEVVPLATSELSDVIEITVARVTADGHREEWRALRWNAETRCWVDTEPVGCGDDVVAEHATLAEAIDFEGMVAEEWIR